MRVSSSAIILAFAAIAAVALAAAASDGRPPAAHAAAGGPEMRLNVHGGTCNDPVRPAQCAVETGASFTLSIDALAVPASGYVHMQTWVDYGNDLIYGKAASPGDEVAWPDCNNTIAYRAQSTAKGSNHVNHACQTFLVPPGPVSSYMGTLVDLSFTCSATGTSTDVRLLPLLANPAGASGSAYTDPTLMGVSAKVADLTIACIDPALDSDGDGCADLREYGSDEMQGGRRDPANGADFYDTNGDRVVDLANDILGVIEHYAPQGQPPYDVTYDRGPVAGPNLWNLTAPDGVIDLANDIFGVIQQYLHDCRP